MEPSVTLRLAEPSDAASLERLSQLESRRRSPGPHLIAEREGRIDAALCLSTDELVADPFQRTAELCELLRSRAKHLRAGTGSGNRHLWPRPRLVTP